MRRGNSASTRSYATIPRLFRASQHYVIRARSLTGEILFIARIRPFIVRQSSFSGIALCWQPSG